MAETWEKVSGYDWINYTDDAIFEIDHDNKTIQHLDGQTIVYGEAKSQYIRFNIDRYYDGIDLSDKDIRVVWKNTAKNGDINAVVNVERSEDGLRFGWLVPAGACQCNGKVSFDIEFTNEDETYVLKTRTYDMRVFGALDAGSVVPEPVGKEWYVTIQERCNTALTKAEEAVTSAAESADRAEKAAEGMEEIAERAEKAATQAAESETAASTSASKAESAKTAAQEAETGAKTAQTSAEGAVETAKTYTEQAKSSATSASTSATEAAEHETNAGNYASTAKTASETAKTAESNAKAAQTASETAQSKAETAQSKAEAAKEAIDTKIDGASEVLSNLQTATTTASDVKTKLDASTGTANTAKSQLEAATTAANTAKSELVTATSTANTAKNELAATTTTANNTKSALDTSIENAETTKSELETATAESVTKIETAGAEQIAAITEAGGGIENAISNYFALRRNGKVFTTKIYKYSTSTSPVGVKMNANEGMACTPSVGRNEGTDDYQQYGLFQHFTCNFSVDSDGNNHVDALEGQTGFTKYGKVQVGEVTMSAWFGLEDTTEAVLYHYSDSQTELTPHPMKECVKPDGTLSPFMIHAKYIAGDIDGKPYSSKDLAPANGCQATEAKDPVSYTGMIAYMHQLGNHYCGETCWDLFYKQLMMIIKYATTHSQSIMAGATSYYLQYKNLVAETGVKRVIVTTAQAANLVVGSTVSIGDATTNTNLDRYYAYMHNKAYDVTITGIEAVDSSNSAVYVDSDSTFDTTTTTYISTMPWRSGATDEVAGSDGSPNSNTNGKNPFKIQGIETGVGAYEVLGNVVMDIVTGSDGNPARDVYVCEDASTLSSNIATVRTSYKKASAQVTYTAGAWKYITEETTDTDLSIMIPTGVGGGSTTGFADGLYTDTGTSGQREWLSLGSLSTGGNAGLWLLFASNGWSSAYWAVVSAVSPNGTRGEWQASA